MKPSERIAELAVEAPLRFRGTELALSWAIAEYPDEEWEKNQG